METKNDIGKPWRFKDGDLTVTRSSVWSPPGCHPTSCGVKFYVDEEGKLDHVEGDENNPVTKGRLCVRCLAMKDYIYNPSRVLYPMKRDRAERGNADAWERITWDEAFAIIKEKVDYFTDTYGPESMLVIAGTGRDGGVENQTLAHRILRTPNACYTQSGYACYLPRCTGSSYILGCSYPEIDYAGGLPGTYDNPAYQVPEVIILWGKSTLASNPDGMFGHAVIDLMKRGSKIIAIDPRVNWLNTRAVKHLRVRPGTDTALGMALLNVIMNEDLYDHDFVERWCYGFDELKERVDTMPPERAAEICGVDAEDIREVARMYAAAKPGAIAWGLAFDQNPNGVQAGHTAMSLMAITGNCDIPGGQLFADMPVMEGHQFEETDTATYGWDRLGDELRDKCIGIKEYPYYVTTALNAHADLMLETLETGKPYQIRSVMIHSSNPLAPSNSAQPKRWHEALSKLEWGWATDCFITPTIQACCDLVLPLSTVAEHDAVTFTHYSAAPIVTGAMTKAVEVGECKSDQELLFELGKFLRPEYFEEYDNLYDWLDDHRLGNKMHFTELQEQVTVQANAPYRKYETGRLRPDGKPGFNTNTGRCELWSTGFNMLGEDPLPYFEEPPYSPVSTPEVFEEYPFILTTGERTYSYFHSEHRQIPVLRELNPNPLLEINPDDALRLGITDGQWVSISNLFGEAKLKAKVTPTVYPGLVHAQHGWWFPEEEGSEPHLFGVWRSNINSLVPHKRIGKLGYGAPYKCNFCKVEPLAESYDADMKAIEKKFKRTVK